MRISDWSSDVCSSDLPYEVPCAPCSTISTLLVFCMLAPMVSQSMLARSSQRKSMTSASTPVCSTASRLCATMDKYVNRSEEHTSELQSLMRISYAVFCLKKKKKKNITNTTTNTHHA